MKSLRELKKYFWMAVTPVWPYARDFLLKLHIIWHEPGRQRYHIGWLAPGRTHEDFKKHMASAGFSDHFIAWVDEGEDFGVRKIDKEIFQYHVRLFKDGEIRGHYEITPEENLYEHFWEIGMEQRRGHFLEFLGDWVDTKRLASQMDVHFGVEEPVYGAAGLEYEEASIAEDQLLEEGDESGKTTSQR